MVRASCTYIALAHVRQCMACRPKDLPTVAEVLAMSLPHQVMITALVAASWTKPQADGRILDNIQKQDSKSKKYIWYLFQVN